jgi:glycosyltransferase involved in cell wall biosynthesis
MSVPAPAQIVLGPAGHGVVEYALDVARATVGADARTPVIRVADPAGLDAALERVGEGDRGDAGAGHERLHLHVTDGILGETPAGAAAVVERIARDRRVSLTLHDLPQASDGERNLRRRGDAYRRMASAAVGVAVSSRHEAALFASHVDAERTVAVVPLGTRIRVAPAPTLPGRPPSDRCTVLVAGYVYPGKGHDDAIDAVAEVSRRTGAPAEVVALGGVSRGHERLADELAARAEASGVRFRVTGFLAADDYRDRVRGSGIPVVAHQHLSASRSLLDWTEEGRRPVVVASRYTLEMAALRPGTLTVVASLADAIERAWQDPGSTTLAAGHRIGPTLDDAARAQLAWWADLPW